ncbi:hypothetical protein K9B33_17880 [Sphingobium sp. 3R8]|uniref:hypothetical protein n=1 Tax=Sphingobium sp. 3R8 TaxID=2874921 RepID=UPI001CC9E32B|nr:hypothetical protein [Sphingobium sp. 3R8]MBZ9649408.1 hypothetical protein [Sphingobium sp. 3R8]
MPTADTTARDYTAAEVTAYEAYLSAIAEHNIICARPGATTREKMDAALAADRALKRFSEAAGMDFGRGTRSPADIATVTTLASELASANEVIRSAYSMLLGILNIGSLDYCKPGDRDNHSACITLLEDAAKLLRAGVAKADGE